MAIEVDVAVQELEAPLWVARVGTGGGEDLAKVCSCLSAKLFILDGLPGAAHVRVVLALVEVDDHRVGLGLAHWVVVSIDIATLEGVEEPGMGTRVVDAAGRNLVRLDRVREADAERQGHGT